MTKMEAKINNRMHDKAKQEVTLGEGVKFGTIRKLAKFQPIIKKKISWLDCSG